VSDSRIPIESLASAFMERMRERYTYQQCSVFRSAIGLLLQFYSGTPADSITPQMLEEIQHHLTRESDPNSKRYDLSYINQLIRSFKTIFEWGAVHKMVSPATAVAIRFVPPVRRDHHADTPAVSRVSDAVVQATLPHLLPTVSAMVQVQRLANMQPYEICRMRVGDLDRSQADGLWHYTTPKKQAYEQSRTIVLGKPEQALILPYLEGKGSEQAVFSPKTALVERHERRAQHRKTEGSVKHVPRTEPLVRNPREHYTSGSYSFSIKQTLDKANRSLPDDQKIPYWTPIQLCDAERTELVHEKERNWDATSQKRQPLTTPCCMMYSSVVRLVVFRSPICYVLCRATPRHRHTAM
jgi:hypothetical protein